MLSADDDLLKAVTVSRKENGDFCVAITVTASFEMPETVVAEARNTPGESAAKIIADSVTSCLKMDVETDLRDAIEQRMDEYLKSMG
jgi:hypothetical protein